MQKAEATYSLSASTISLQLNKTFIGNGNLEPSGDNAEVLGPEYFIEFVIWRNHQMVRKDDTPILYSEWTDNWAKVVSVHSSEIYIRCNI
jgi:hypothetical protein